VKHSVHCALDIELLLTSLTIGVFTELISGMGAKSIQVEEVFSLDDSSLDRIK
jgi:hypothetical protein